MMGIVAALLITLGATAPLQAVLEDPAGSAPVEASAAAESPSTTQTPASGSGLPPRAAPPRTMRDQWPVFAVFAVSWVAIVGYLVAAGRKADRLAKEIAAREGAR